MTAALILFGVSAAVAQSAVTGKIVDETGAPLIGASVTVPGTSQGVSTDVDGNFTLKTDAKEIEISYVGYVPTKKPVTGPNARLGIIQMEPDAVALQDVIVMQSVAVPAQNPGSRIDGQCRGDQLQTRRAGVPRNPEIDPGRLRDQGRRRLRRLEDQHARFPGGQRGRNGQRRPRERHGVGGGILVELGPASRT